MDPTEWVITEDEYGIYKKRTNEMGLEEELIERKQKWYEENPPLETEPQPQSEIEILKQENAILQLALAETIEKQELNQVQNQVALAEVIETLYIKGVL